MMCLNRVFNWSLTNQIESERLMTLPSDLPSDGLLVGKCCIHVDASSVSNGIARLIMEFAFGFNKRLIGMPRVRAGLHDDAEDSYEDSDEDIDEDSNEDSNEGSDEGEEEEEML
jgi:hypothetical protein